MAATATSDLPQFKKSKKKKHKRRKREKEKPSDLEEKKVSAFPLWGDISLMLVLLRLNLLALQCVANSHIC